MPDSKLAGVYAASVTPLKEDGALDLPSFPELLAFLARRGCHGALILGTTGEGPSFSIKERERLYRAAVKVRKAYPDFRLLAGTGTPSLQETVELTRLAFDIGFEGVVVLPPYYYRSASHAGLFAWFATVLEDAVPETGALFGYHIPQVSGVPLSVDLIGRLSEAYPTRFAGLKDSSGSLEFGEAINMRFSNRLAIFTGNDRLLSRAMSWGAAGGITALANIISPTLRTVWESIRAGMPADAAQTGLDSAREISDRYAPAAGLMKAVLHRSFGFPEWSMRLPLHPPDQKMVNQAVEAFEHTGLLNASTEVGAPGSL